MKFLLSFICIFAAATATRAQSNINDLLSSGIEDAERFSDAYLAPVSEGAIYSLSGSWLNSATAKPLGGFEISIIGSIAPFGNKDDKKRFNLVTDDYENLRFEDGSPSRLVSTALGDIEGVRVVVEDETGLFSDSFELPSGLASEGINIIPAGFIQASVGLIKGTEVKARFLPKIRTDEVEVGLYGFGLLHEITSHIPERNGFPVSIAAFIGYTRLNAEYDFTNTDFIDGEDQRIDTRTSTWTFQALAGTRLPIINFYGGLGYISGKADSDVLGTYRVTSGPYQTTYVDPFSLQHKESGVTASLGAKLKLGFFRLHVDYTFAGFNLLTAGINFGFR